MYIKRLQMCKPTQLNSSLWFNFVQVKQSDGVPLVLMRQLNDELAKKLKNTSAIYTNKLN